MSEIARKHLDQRAPSEPRRRSRKELGVAIGGALATLPLTLWFWGFTVDDAFIIGRVAAMLASGHGYRFNVDGPVVDAVTPLGYAPLLAALGPGDTLEMVGRSRLLGLICWLLACALVSLLVAKSPGPRARLAALAGLALSVPGAAWASSGMETGLVSLLATLALVGGRWSDVAAGAAAALRPELLPWALTLGLGRSLFTGPAGTDQRLRGSFVTFALVAGPALGVALIRHVFFGSAAPLSVLAKPSDLAHGFRYAFGATVFGAAPLLVIAPLALARADALTRVLAAAGGAQLAALILAGGDWMALYRLLVPVIPTFVFCGARLFSFSPIPVASFRLACMLGSSIFVLQEQGPAARSVMGHRLALIARAKPVLMTSRAIAVLDVGWVGAATDARIVDLAGVTDPVVAVLPGGHTSKRFGNGLLETRGVDTMILLLAPKARVADPWQASEFARGSDQRLAKLPLSDGFRAIATLPLGGTEQAYLVARAP